MSTPMGQFFTLEEFAVSASHPELVEPVPEELIPNVGRLVATILDPMRHVLGRPIRITSGYRSPRLNDAVEGSRTSQHKMAQAADIETERIRELFRSMLLREPKYPTGQVIAYPRRGFIHVALPNATYREPTFFICTAPKAYQHVVDEAGLRRYWPESRA